VKANGKNSSEQPGARELAELRRTCWHQTHEIQTLRATIDVLRAGANSLAIDNAILRAENATMHMHARTARPDARARRTLRRPSS
jgi:hypothetical protein